MAVPRGQKIVIAVMKGLKHASSCNYEGKKCK